MIKINVAEIKKQLIGSASYHYELDPEALDLTEDDVSLEGQVVADFTLHNGGELILFCQRRMWTLSQTFGAAPGFHFGRTVLSGRNGEPSR